MSGLALMLPVLAAQAPDPGNPSIISLGAAVGGLAGGLAARLHRLAQERIASLTVSGTLVGGACGLSLYLATYLL